MHYQSILLTWPDPFSQPNIKEKVVWLARLIGHCVMFTVQRGLRWGHLGVFSFTKPFISSSPHTSSLNSVKLLVWYWAHLWTNIENEQNSVMYIIMLLLVAGQHNSTEMCTYREHISREYCVCTYAYCSCMYLCLFCELGNHKHTCYILHTMYISCQCKFLYCRYLVEFSLQGNGSHEQGKH